jgi:CelD/BcsL family acetyltransferase involved in cellulose biosynthesis
MSASPEPAPSEPLIVETIGSLDAVRDEWSALAQASGNVFSSWEWATTWWRQRGHGRRLLLQACRGERGRLAAILPLYLASRRPVRVARFLGHGPADELGPVCAPADRHAAAHALSEAAVRARLDVLFAELLPGRYPWSAELGGKVVRREASPTLSLDGWEPFLAGRSANFRQQVRGRERRLARAHALAFRLADDPARLDEDLVLLMRLHEARWGARSPFLRWREFHAQFARVALERGWLRLWFLELDGRPAAAWYGFRFGRVESYYQAGRDLERGEDSVGFVLLAHTIREAASDGMREYRFLRGGEPVKSRFADADPGLETVVVTRGARGRLAGAAAAGALRSDRARSLLGRLVAGGYSRR